MRDGPRELVRRFVCWLLGHHPVGPAYYSPMCARCGLPLRSDATPWGQADDAMFDNEIQFASGPTRKDGAA